jgi:exoenzyme U
MAVRWRRCEAAPDRTERRGETQDMPPPDPTLAMHAWIKDLFGVDPRDYARAAIAGAPGAPVPPSVPNPSPPRDQPGTSPGGVKIGVGPAKVESSFSKTAPDPAVWTRAIGTALTKDGPDRPGARINKPAPMGPPTVCKGANGKEISVEKSADGKVALTRDPPPIQEITFSGGGGKGAALPGAVWALAQTGALAEAKEIHGASVGSMTAAVLAAGMSPKEFQDLSDKTNFGKVVSGDDILPWGHDGKGLEALVREKMKSALNGQIATFAADALAKGTKVDPKDQAVLDEMSRKFASGAGPTFGDLRKLSKIIPAIKEVVISGTQIGTGAPPGKDGKPGKVQDSKPELKVFSADTEPDLEVAEAVHASAALPPVFKPVDLKLHDGSTGRFEDGGVLNNAPSSDTLGTGRNVDPVPDKSKMTFVFEDDAAHDIAKGVAKPERSRLNDLVSGAENSAAEYSKNKTLSERPEDVVMVPLKFKRTNGKEEDYSGLKGTLAFDMPKEDRIKLQDMSEAETKAFLEKKRQKETRGFASDSQMLNCIPREDLVTLAGSDYAGAKDTLAFRDDVIARVRALEALAGQGLPANDPKIVAALKDINDAAKGDQERIAFIGRALNESGKLDALLAASRDPTGKPATGLDALDAGIAVNEVVMVRATAKKILDQTLYPKMIREGSDGVEGQLLKQMEDILRAAKKRRDINRALTIGIDYYNDKVDLGGLLGNGKYAAELRAWLQPTH